MDKKVTVLMVKRLCGHVTEERFYNKDQMKYRLQVLAETKCDVCIKEELLEEARRNAWPALEGTSREVSAANRIRSEIYREFLRRKNPYELKGLPATSAKVIGWTRKMNMIENIFHRETAASYWFKNQKFQIIFERLQCHDKPKAMNKLEFCDKMLADLVKAAQ